MKATLWHAWAGQALLPLAPLATVAALILAPVGRRTFAALGALPG